MQAIVFCSNNLVLLSNIEALDCAGGKYEAL